MTKHRFLTIALITGLNVCLPGLLAAQTPNRYLPYSFEFTQKLNRKVYDVNTFFHSSFKPVFIDDPVLSSSVDSIFDYGSDTLKRSWAHRKLFHEHLIGIKKPDYTFFADYLPDLQAGKESENSRNTWLNTRGFQAGGTIGNTLSFYASLYENQAKLPGYLNRIVVRDSIITGQTIESHLLANRPINTTDWAYSTALISYTPVKYVNLQLGYDKNFIGDGYRSVILSDLAANYPFFKTTFELGNVKLMTTIAQLTDLHADKLSYENGYRKKWAVFHYLDWNINKRLSLGIFESIIWQDADESGKRGFDLSYVNPLSFMRPVERQNGSPDNAMFAVNVKYEALRNLSVYGQFLLDELSFSEFFKPNGYWANKWAMQFGLRGFDAFKIKNLNYLAEFNMARPYTFTEQEPINNYAHYSQPIGHPFGTNFREFVTVLNYAYKRLGFAYQLNSGLYGRNPAGKNVGGDIYESYTVRDQDFGNRIGQGIKTDFLYTEGRVSFMIKPRLNFRVEAGLVYRKEQSSLNTEQTNWFTFGIRSSFRNLYQDL